jgi:transposase
MSTQKRYSSEFKDRAVRLVEEQQKEGLTQWAAMQSISKKLGCTAETLRRWVRRGERDEGKRPGLTTAEAEELRRLRRENKELKRANDILRTASAYFAQAELDRRRN